MKTQGGSTPQLSHRVRVQRYWSCKHMHMASTLATSMYLSMTREKLQLIEEIQYYQMEPFHRVSNKTSIDLCGLIQSLWSQNSACSRLYFIEAGLNTFYFLSLSLQLQSRITTMIGANTDHLIGKGGNWPNKFASDLWNKIFIFDR